ncbi:bifunctional nitrate reductase/sulfite reductase flavoprotein subunit alpha [Komagataeibacter oboediens]|uniref:bifunctional nitrate reductase/sulfite reductase flavoprotein subunit alpha n=1 Tax=Komagataeibacter oboediens TaxID=65958 RepID=UPI001C2D24F8|nr:bifunctional nitrate reductase/sulfite reductase flavoprotein subunit alpha [Komagataeibacter oboediens]MBV1825447.1 bifunctional nitrate reductase/sulfite reductase flavoprotein subunit alpha [Komagataeibacter oboediens]
MAREDIRTVCPYCGVGCGVILEVENGRIAKVRGDGAHPANGGRLCTKGSSCDRPLLSDQRLRHAAIRPRRGEQAAPAGVQQAIDATAARLRAILDEHGPDAIAFYVSGQMSLEAQYLINKLAKGFVRTQHIESNSRLCMAAAGTGYKLSLGADAPPGSYEDFDCTNLFFVIGANMADCHPILFLRLMDRRRAGARLIVVDPRRTATAEKADLYLPIRPGTDLALLNGLLHLLVKNDAIDRDFIARTTTGWEAMEPFLDEYAPRTVAEITGLPVEDILTAARWIAEAGEWMSLWTMGLNQSVAGTWNTNALCNLHLATGAICRPGSGPFSLTGQPNAMGGREMGYMGPGLPGQRSALVAADRAFTEEQWSLPPGTLRDTGGNGVIAMFEAMERGDIRACWVICTNPVATVANRRHVVRALEAADCVIVQDAFADGETTRFADIVLPAALWAEGDGVQVNSDRTMTLARRAVPPPGEALPDWDIIARVARAMGFAQDFAFTSAAEVFAEASRFSNPKTGYDIAGVSHARLRNGPVQWPAPAGDTQARHPIRYLSPDGTGPVFATPDGKGVFFARPWMRPDEWPDEEFPFVLNSGRLQHQWHTLTKTGRVDSLNRLNPGPFVEIAPPDARALGLTQDDRVRITSRRGQIALPVRISARVRPGTCFAPFHWNDRFGPDLTVNSVTPDGVDPISLQPGFKLCAVALERVQQAAGPATDDVEPVRKGESAMTLRALTSHLGLERPDQPVAAILTEEGRAWLSGFLDGLEMAPPGTGEVPVLPASAPLPAQARARISGILAGLYSRMQPGDGTVQAPAATPPGISVWWASQTGRAEGLAATIVGWLREAGHTAEGKCLDAFDAHTTPAGPALFVVSTFGDGDPPDCAAPFWDMLRERRAPMPDLTFAVLALGDSSYASFCGFGRALDGRLRELGATPFVDRVDCEPDFEETVEAWRATMLPALAQAGTGGQATVPATPALADAPSPPVSGTREAPVMARLSINERLCAAGCDRDTRRIGLDVSGTELNWVPGDALGIWPSNPAAHVDAALRALRLPDDTPVALRGCGTVGLHEALTRHFDLSRPNPAMLAALGGRAPGFLPHLLKDASLPVTAQDVPGLFRRMQPRLYSIASSPQASGRVVELTMGVSHTPWPGICSNWLAGLDDGADVPVFIQPTTHFRLPADDAAAMIMIGPGTGIAPFRGFLQERAARQSPGRNWLFFGERHAAEGFYYRDELDAFLSCGVLTRLDTAFSRDQPERVYVQDRMEAAGDALWDWLRDGAYIYVCGDATRMARDVDAALRRIVARHGDLSSGDADAFISSLTREGRYLRDVY